MTEKPDPYSRRIQPRTRFEGHALKAHRHAHPDPSHHIGPCTAADRAGQASHVHREGRHIYDGPGARYAKADFTRRYGVKKGPRVYGALLGKMHRQALLRRRSEASARRRQGARRRRR